MQMKLWEYPQQWRKSIAKPVLNFEVLFQIQSIKMDVPNAVEKILGMYWISLTDVCF